MGGGRWSEATYSASTSAAKAAGKSAFDYDHTTKATKPSSAWTAHTELDPKGVEFRESRDSDEHPNSVAIAVLFDVTGSMAGVPRVLQEKLPELFGLLLRKGYVEDPQIMFGAVGDAFSDRVPLQVGQFESDNRLDENLGKIFLEGGGGGGNHESYELAMYFMDKHTATDCYEKRGHRGYLFIIGDERSYTTVQPNQARDILGDSTLSQPLDIDTMIKQLQEKWDVYFLQPKGGSYAENDAFWQPLLGQQYIKLDDDAAVCETIALTIGIGEGSIDLDEGVEDLKEIGSAHAEAVGKALATVGGKGVVSESDTPTGIESAEGDGATRL